MTTLGHAFVAELHNEHLKPLGFKKSRHTFIRSHNGYAEHYQIQGSAWNSPLTSWTCYLNCGISFEGLAARSPDKDFPRTHAWMRSELFVKDARPQYDVTVANKEITAKEIAHVIYLCSDYFQRRHAVLLESYKDGHYDRGFLADPELAR
jgi:hypothetical protein